MTGDSHPKSRRPSGPHTSISWMVAAPTTSSAVPVALGVLQQIRDSDIYTPTLFLTARDSVIDRVTGLTAGRRRYMTKPFSLEELVARLRGLLRRSAYLTPADDESLTVGDLELDDASREVTRDGEPISLTSTEFELLRVLMRNPRKALSRQEILRRVWNYDFGGRSSIVDLYVSYLRRNSTPSVNR